MNTPVKANAEKPVNYTAAMVALIKAQEPVNLAKARILAKELKKSVPSIIAKCGTEGIKYDKKPAAQKKPAKVTKAQLVIMIEKVTDRGGMLGGLEKATSAALLQVLNGCQHLAFSEANETD